MLAEQVPPDKIECRERGQTFFLIPAAQGITPFGDAAALWKLFKIVFPQGQTGTVIEQVDAVHAKRPEKFSGRINQKPFSIMFCRIKMAGGPVRRTGFPAEIHCAVSCFRMGVQLFPLGRGISGKLRFVLQFAGPLRMFVLAEAVDAGVETLRRFERGGQRGRRFFQTEIGELEETGPFRSAAVKTDLIYLRRGHVLLESVESVKIDLQALGSPALFSRIVSMVAQAHGGLFAGFQTDAAVGEVVSAPLVVAGFAGLDHQADGEGIEIFHIHGNYGITRKIEILSRLRTKCDPRILIVMFDGGNFQSDCVVPHLPGGSGFPELMIVFRSAGRNIEKSVSAPERQLT